MAVLLVCKPFKAAIFRRKPNAPARPLLDLKVEITKSGIGFDNIIGSDKNGTYKTFHSTVFPRYDFDAKLLEEKVEIF